MKKIKYLIPAIALIMMFTLMAASQAFASEAIVIVEEHPSAGVVKLFGRKTTIFYNEDTCADKCRFNQTITNAAYKALPQVPKPYITGVYTRIKNNETGTYTVCFDTRLINHPAIYRFVGGLWIFVKSGESVDELCANGIGDGVIGLFGIVTERTPAITPTPTPLSEPL